MPHSQTPLIVFSHANSFPAGTYGLLFRSLRARGFAVKAIDKFGHDPRYPVSSNWPHPRSKSTEARSSWSAIPWGAS